MDNNQMPPVQPLSQPTPSMGSVLPVAPAQPLQPLGQSVVDIQSGQALVPNAQPAQVASVSTNITTSVPTSAQMAAAAAAAAQPKKSHAKLIMGITIGVLVILSGVFIGLFIWKNGEFADLSENVDLKIAEAESNAREEQIMADAEEAKKDTRQFTGPTDYGQLSFDYPKSWSVYIESDASKGGNFVAYLNPIEIEPVSDSTVYALRVNIRDEAFDKVVDEYQKNLERSKGALSMETVTIGQDQITANRYTGVIPGTELNGIIVIFKIRDKTVILRTDSILLEKDFQTILDSVKFSA